MRNIYQFSVLRLTGFSLISHGLSTDCRAIGRKWGLLVTSDPYQAYPAFPAGAPYQFVEEPAVQLVAAGPVKQRRLTVAFRLILAIPHTFVLFFLDLAGFVVVFLGWWGALFTGRLPGFAVSYLSGLARWNARVYGYSFLLTDDYPPFTFDDDLAYPVVIDIPAPGRLNRFAVFFRLILAVWAHIVLSVVTSVGNVIVVFPAWLIMLITGKLPAPLHLAFTAVLRFQTRYYCYLACSPRPTRGSCSVTSRTPRRPRPRPCPGLDAPAEPTAPAESALGHPARRRAPPAYGARPPAAYGTAPAYERHALLRHPPPGYGTPAPGYGTQAGLRHACLVLRHAGRIRRARRVRQRRSRSRRPPAGGWSSRSQPRSCSIVLHRPRSDHQRRRASRPDRPGESDDQLDQHHKPPRSASGTAPTTPSTPR